MTSNKQRGGSPHMEITPVLPTAGQKFSPYSAGYLELFKYLNSRGALNDDLRNPEPWLGNVALEG
jgi:hypothetical protein